MPLLVVKHSGPSLLGRNWLQKFTLDWREIHSIQLNPTEALLEKYHTVIVPVIKPDKKSVRICGDFKQTVNPVAKLDKYPIPKVEDLFVQLTGGCTFTKIDLSQAYLQVP